MSGSVIQKCRKNCVNEFQDKKYGPGMRVHIINKNKEFVCTCCGGANLDRKSRAHASTHNARLHG